MNKSKDIIAILNLSKIQSFFDKNKEILKDQLNLKILKEKKLINKKYEKLKILGTGDLKSKIDVTTHFISKQAQKKIEKLGGKLNIVKK